MKKYKLIIFETNRQDGCMSLARKFYPSSWTPEQIRESFQNTKERIGKKYNFDSKHILQPSQKDVEKDIQYNDGQYIKITPNILTKEDYWDEKLPCDVLLIDTSCPNVVIGHRMADCPIVIAEDISKQVVAVSHCGASQINREVPKWIIKALKKEVNSNPNNIRIYIGSCIKKESYQYDRYPLWATNKKVWKKSIIRKNNIYYIDLLSAIRDQLLIEGILKNNIQESSVDTYKDKNYYSHTEEVKDKNSNIGQNFVGCFYQEIESE